MSDFTQSPSRQTPTLKPTTPNTILQTPSPKPQTSNPTPQTPVSQYSPLVLVQPRVLAIGGVMTSQPPTPNLLFFVFINPQPLQMLSSTNGSPSTSTTNYARLGREPGSLTDIQNPQPPTQPTNRNAGCTGSSTRATTWPRPSWRACSASRPWRRAARSAYTRTPRPSSSPCHPPLYTCTDN